MDERSPHEIWLGMVAEADLSPDSRFAGTVADAIRRVVRAKHGEPLAPLVVRDPRTAAELSAAYLREWRRQNPGWAGREGRAS